MAVRYDSGAVDAAPLARPLHFHQSNKTAKNRFLKSPMAEGLATWSPTNLPERGIPTDELIELYRRWGESENPWGIIVTGNMDIQFDALDAIGDMIITPECPPEGERFEKFKQLSAAAKANGSLIVAQVTHPGRQLQKRLNPIAISASDVQLEPNFGMTFAKPRPATKDDIADLINRYAYAASYLEKAGFDGIELHAAHGYLISQFLSRTTNLRTDEYGVQNTENRLRFLSEIIREIKARVSPNFIVGAKLNSVEFQDGGVTPDEAREVCETLERLGLDYVELSGGTYEETGLSWAKESTRKREAFFIEFAEKVVSALGEGRQMKVYIAGGLRSTKAMVDALDVVDGVALGRPAAAEPRLPDEILRKGATGALRPVEAFEDNFGTGMPVAQTQLAQISRGIQPLSAGDAAAMTKFGEDMAAWFQKVVEDGDKMEFVRAVEYSGPQVPYGTVAV